VRDDGPGVLRKIFCGNGEDEWKAVDYIYQRGCVNYERDPNQRRLHLSAFASLLIGSKGNSKYVYGGGSFGAQLVF
jgi:hypothetical protein